MSKAQSPALKQPTPTNIARRRRRITVSFRPAIPRRVAPQQSPLPLRRHCQYYILRLLRHMLDNLPYFGSRLWGAPIGGPDRPHEAANTDGDRELTHGVPRATTVLAKMSSFLAHAMRATLCGFPFAVSRR